MPHRSESGKIITSKTPLLSNHSPKLSTSPIVKTSIKMKNKSNTCAPEFGTPDNQTPKGNTHLDEVSSLPLKQEECNQHSNGSDIDGTMREDEGEAAVKGERVRLDSLTALKPEEETELESGQESPSLKNGFLHFQPQIKEQCDVPCRKDFIKTLDDLEGVSRPKKIYRVVLTGGKQ